MLTHTYDTPATTFTQLASKQKITLQGNSELPMKYKEVIYQMKGLSFLSALVQKEDEDFLHVLREQHK
jgi:hypothetical protein